MTVELKIYQIDHEKDTERVRFENYRNTIEWVGKVDPKIYHKVWSSGIDEKKTEDMDRFLEDVYVALNLDREKPEGFEGHSLSVSDVVTVGDKAYFVDSIGFREIDGEGFEGNEN